MASRVGARATQNPERGSEFSRGSTRSQRTFSCAARRRTESLIVVSGLSSRRSRRRLLSPPPSPSCSLGPPGHRHRRPTSNALANNNSTQLASSATVARRGRATLNPRHRRRNKAALSESPQRVPKSVINDPEPVLQPQWLERSCCCCFFNKKKENKKQKKICMTGVLLYKCS